MQRGLFALSTAFKIFIGLFVVLLLFLFTVCTEF